MTDTDEQMLMALMESKPDLYQSKLLLEREARGFDLGRVRGRAQGTAEALVQVILTRGRKITDEERSKIYTCDDVAQLLEWVRRAAGLPSMADVLESDIVGYNNTVLRR
ncbi:hypothetical protein LO763_06515 [Glycomyces sp. A-F 0318]|uniref:hypothetical protein n=1 Tax=Glycomyces amatae TaxID=2881355 RepID=UPI001E388D37|nr:hypothetical protein [Glycomyces amatae]MCD0443278.1 hypothetical protein [Glycomyces amatae]